jgi:hypothetical protein
VQAALTSAAMSGAPNSAAGEVHHGTTKSGGPVVARGERDEGPEPDAEQAAEPADEQRLRGDQGAPPPRRAPTAASVARCRLLAPPADGARH